MSKVNTKPSIVRWVNDCPEIFLPSMVGTKFETMIINPNRLLADGDTNVKTKKNSWLTCGHSMMPWKFSGIGNVCSSATDGCSTSCLTFTGNAAIFKLINASRTAKTACWFLARDWYLEALETSLLRWQAKADRRNESLCCRLNMFSDIPWERYIDLSRFKGIEFYDYSKIVRRAGSMAKNYWITLSRSELNQYDCIDALSKAKNVAVVFYDNLRPAMGQNSKKQRLPKTWMGYQVLDGDVSDARFADVRGRKHGRVIGLRLKAANWANYNSAITSGFSVPTFP